MANDNTTAFDEFMLGYWNQMASDIYADFKAALADFKATAGDSRYADLLRELSSLNREGRFPRLAEIDDAYDDPFWSRYGRILTNEDFEACRETLQQAESLR